MSTPYDNKILLVQVKGRYNPGPSIAELARSIRAHMPNVAGVLLETSQGRRWQGSFERPSSDPKAVTGPDRVREWVEAFGAEGLEVHVWGVPRGEDLEAEAAVLVAAAAVPGVRSLALDVERGRFYWGGSEADAVTLMQAIRDGVGPDSHIGLILDARNAHLHVDGAQHFIPFADSLHPMIYPMAFRRPIDEALAESIGNLRPIGKPIVPMLQCYAEGDRRATRAELTDQGRMAFESGVAGISFFCLGDAHLRDEDRPGIAAIALPSPVADTPARAAKLGLDVNRPIDPATGAASPTTNPALVPEARWVRLNFVLGPWESPDTKKWRARYDRLVDGFAARGTAVHGLIGHESVARPLGAELQADGPGPDPAAAEAWLDAYVKSFAAIVGHFRGRVGRFESFNEPNNWRDGRPWVSPYWFAALLARVYRAVKIDGGMRDVELVSGPLLAHNNGGEENRSSIGWGYLQDTYRAGKRFHGWDAIRSATDSFPLDGVGYHLYVDQGPSASADDIAGSIRTYVDAIQRVVADEEGPGSHKRVFVSEVGWQSHVVGEDPQAQNLRVAAAILGNDPRVGAAIWFSMQDFPDAGQPEGRSGFGLFRMDGLGAGAAKAARGAFQDVATAEVADTGEAPAELAPPLADGFAFPLQKPGRDVFDDYKIDTRFMDPVYFKANRVWHPGEDWNGRGGGDTDLGEPVYAAAHGRVVTSRFFPAKWGNIVLIEHRLTNGSRMWSQYAHLDQRLVRAGEVVGRGQCVGTMGKGAGGAFLAHLHFELRTQELPAENWFQPVSVRDKERIQAFYTSPTPYITGHLAGTTPFAPVGLGREIVLDSESADPLAGMFSMADVPSWFTAPFGYQGSTRWTWTTAERVVNWGEWRPNLPRSGDYELQVFVPRDRATTRRARYEVHHREGHTDRVVDQNAHFDVWVPLGRFPFEAGTRGFVRLTDVTGEPAGLRLEIAFDAVKWVPLLV